jgi:ABC-type lipoprotein release transport system permease subunit
MGMVTMSVALLLVALTWIRGVFGSMLETASATGGHVRVVTAAYAAREELMPLDEHLPDTGRLVDTIRRQPGVTQVEPRITAGVTLTVGEEIGDVFAMVVGASDDYFRRQLAADQRLAAGAWFTGAPDELVAGAQVVMQLGAAVGDEVVLLGQTQDGSLSSIKGRLVGVLGRGSGLDHQVLAPLERVQYLVDIPEGAVELLVYGGELDRAAALARALRDLPALDGLAVQALAEREPWKSMLPSVKGMEAAVIFLFVFLTALGIWNTMMMSVLERTHEIGVLRAMGLGRLGAVSLLVGEALAIALAGGLSGIALGLAPAWLLERHGITIGEKTAGGLGIPIAETIHGNLSPDLVLLSLGLGLLMAILGSLLPALRAASIQPVSAMRAGR